MRQASVRARLSWLAVAAAAGSGACAHYQPRPIVPGAVTEQLDARSLTSPALAEAIEQTSLAAGWPPDAWDLHTLTAAALFYSPDLETARASWAVARAGLITAGLRPNPGISGGPGVNASGQPDTVTPWILSLDLDFTIETAGKRGIRIAEAQQISSAARFEIAAAAWQVRARVRQALLDLFAATGSAAVLERQQTLQDTNLLLFQRQLDAGEISRFEMAQARLQRDNVRLALADARRQQQDARARLAMAVGVPLAALDGLEIQLDAFERLPADLPDRTATREALLNRADLLGALATYEASQAALQLEIARQYPDIHLGPGYQLDQGDSKWTLLLFPAVLPVFHRNEGPIAEAEARRAAAAADVTAVQAGVIGAVDRALAAYRTAVDKLAVSGQSLDEVRALAETAEAQLAAGEISQLDLGTVQVEVAARELARLQALVEAQQELGNVEDAMQRPADLPVDPLPRDAG